MTMHSLVLLGEQACLYTLRFTYSATQLGKTKRLGISRNTDTELSIIPVGYEECVYLPLRDPCAQRKAGCLWEKLYESTR